MIVPDDQLSLAIGRDGQNARLAARLTGWRVDIKSETEFAQEDEEIEYEGEEASDGHCMAVLANGRRCPNAAIGGSAYCGLPAHQALSRFETNQIAILAPLAESEIEILADPEGDEGQVAEIVARAEAEFVEEAEEEVAEEEASRRPTKRPRPRRRPRRASEAEVAVEEVAPGRPAREVAVAEEARPPEATTLQERSSSAAAEEALPTTRGDRSRRRGAPAAPGSEAEEAAVMAKPCPRPTTITI